jgi:hypothetical protein
MLYFLNSPVLSNWGEFHFTKISTMEAISLWNSTPDSEKLSAVGHKATTELLNKLGFYIKENRIQIKMNSGDKALVLKINKRLTEGNTWMEESKLSSYLKVCFLFLYESTKITPFFACFILVQLLHILIYICIFFKICINKKYFISSYMKSAEVFYSLTNRIIGCTI